MWLVSAPNYHTVAPNSTTRQPMMNTYFPLVTKREVLAGPMLSISPGEQMISPPSIVKFLC
jgi:hypothetical protein